MSAPHRTVDPPRTLTAPDGGSLGIHLTRLPLDAAMVAGATDEELQRALVDAPGDAVLLEWSEGARPARPADEGLRGLYRVLGVAARVQRVTFPARWLPVRRPSAVGSDDVPEDARLLAIARSDAALQRLFDEAACEIEGRGLARPDEPVVLLGVNGDALTTDPAANADSSSVESCRRAEHWIHRLGADRVALVVPVDADDGHPFVALARRRSLPLLAVGSGTEVPRRRAAAVGDVSASTPLLWTDFQLDDEHRLPDETHVPGLRDLLHRGALLRERTLYERLPEVWRMRVDSELRALYAWHVSPLLRRLAAIVQTCDAVAGVHVQVPLPQLRSVTAYLLGLTDQRPHDEVLVLEDPVESARRLATAIQGFDRILHVRVEHVGWAPLHARLAAWSEGGLLAACSDARGRGVHTFCFSGRPLGLRAPVRRGVDGIGRIGLDRDDRRVLGWFDLHCTVEEEGAAAGMTEMGGLPASTTSPSSPASTRRARREQVGLSEVLGLDTQPSQLRFGFDDVSSFRENTA